MSMKKLGCLVEVKASRRLYCFSSFFTFDRALSPSIGNYHNNPDRPDTFYETIEGARP